MCRWGEGGLEDITGKFSKIFLIKKSIPLMNFCLKPRTPNVFERGSERRKSEHRRVRTSKRKLERSERPKSLRRKHDRKSLRRKSNKFSNLT